MLYIGTNLKVSFSRGIIEHSQAVVASDSSSELAPCPSETQTRPSLVHDRDIEGFPYNRRSTATIDARLSTVQAPEVALGDSEVHSRTLAASDDVAPRIEATGHHATDAEAATPGHTTDPVSSVGRQSGRFNYGEANEGTHDNRWTPR